MIISASYRSEYFVLKIFQDIPCAFTKPETSTTTSDLCNPSSPSWSSASMRRFALCSPGSLRRRWSRNPVPNRLRSADARSRDKNRSPFRWNKTACQWNPDCIQTPACMWWETSAACRRTGRWREARGRRRPGSRWTPGRRTWPVRMCWTGWSTGCCRQWSLWPESSSSSLLWSSALSSAADDTSLCGFWTRPVKYQSGTCLDCSETSPKLKDKESDEGKLDLHVLLEWFDLQDFINCH